ncbi:hypothetical protein KL949_000907 [Ogataea haglerorum]|nr:hypothetical protein KL950_001467 [Ogataea haglerorum]KAG7721175.1 hypothetical protein KL913_000911 [Ogataea haglerorum]KAG7721929.1 hypothetical protein KL949_000907 [Ogataea haglerorum]KAG7770258.1 hypothetical protein KL931_002022 [Ogataea haglerorum]
MDPRGYLKSYGWIEGEALQRGGLKRPILVSHKKNVFGIGHTSNQAEAWWEKMFDGQLKSLDVTSKNGAVSFVQDEKSFKEFAKSQSPLYKMFVKGGVLQGTIKKEPEIDRPGHEQLMIFDLDDSKKKGKKRKKDRKQGKHKEKKRRRKSKRKDRVKEGKIKKKYEPKT